jgi:hypothetical protein
MIYIYILNNILNFKVKNENDNLKKFIIFLMILWLTLLNLSLLNLYHNNYPKLKNI